MVSLVLEAVRRGGFPALGVFLLHVALLAFGVYDHVTRADVVMHAGGGVAIAFFFARALALLKERGLAGANARWVDDLLVLALTATAAVFWEFYEFTIDHLGWAAAQNGLTDTMLDLALGLGGGLLFVVGARVRGS